MERSMNRLALPANYQATKVDAVEESVADISLRHIRELVDSSLRDLNGGLMPTKKKIQQHLKGIAHSDGKMFYWKHRPMLFVSNPNLRLRHDGKLDIDIVHKKLYLKETTEPAKASN